MAEVETATSDDAKKFVLEQLKLYVDLYKHHWDLYLKGQLLFYAILGALGGYLFGKQLTVHEKDLVMIAVAVSACVVAVASVISLQWVRAVKATISTLEGQLGSLRYSFTGPERIVMLFGIVSVALALVALARVLAQG